MSENSIIETLTTCQGRRGEKTSCWFPERNGVAETIKGGRSVEPFPSTLRALSGGTEDVPSPEEMYLRRYLYVQTLADEREVRSSFRTARCPWHR